jgi:hypothetical protein
MRVWNGSSWQASAGSLVGNADTATRLQTPRTLTIGNTGKSFDGSANVSWSLAEIGVTAATETTSGIVELATAAEVLAGTDTVRAVTPAGLLAGLLGAGSVGTSGYIKIPFRDKTSGVRRDLIVQWGKATAKTFVSVGDLTATVNFPVAFPNAVLFAGGSAIPYSMQPAVRSYGVLFRITDYGPSLTTLNCGLWNPAFNYQNGDSCQFFWFAIGV